MSDEPLDEQPPVEPQPARPRRPVLHRPLPYVLLLAFLVGSYFGHWFPVPDAPDGGKRGEADVPQRVTLEDLLRDHRELSFGVAAAHLVPLIVGLGLLLGYVILRAHNIRVFPRHGFPMVPWDAWHLMRCLVVFFVVHRLVGTGVLWLQHFRRAGHAWADIPRSVVLAGVSNAIAVAMCIFVVALVAAGGGNPFRLLGFCEKRPLSQAALGVTGFLMLFPLLFLVTILMLILWSRAGVSPQLQEVLAGAGRLTLPGWLILVASIVVVAPVTEELLFRGFFYATLRRHMGPLGAIVVSAFLFSFLHGHPFYFVQLFLIGFLLAYLYERTGSLVASIAAHAANNAYTLLIFCLTFSESPV